MVKEVMTVKHKLWDEFANRLEGKEGCDFKRDSKGELEWTCFHSFKFSKRILKRMGIKDVPGSLKYFEKHGGFCDCEVLFNVDKS